MALRSDNRAHALRAVRRAWVRGRRSTAPFVRDIFAHGEHPLARESGEAVLFGGAQDHSSIITVSPLALVPAFVCCA